MWSTNLLLWNRVFDELFKMEMLPGVKITGFADDALINVQAWDTDRLEKKFDRKS